mmetsp:Transcript_21701/g.29100  ORF Transcript_21701/g.29100 Transcript_21701/m.29100 type:complete len:82 (-) Transcript_21701:402-647(-)
MPVFSFLPRMTDFRCHMLSYHLLMWHLNLMLIPNELRVDPFDLLCSGSGAFFHIFITPGGRLSGPKDMKVRREDVATLWKP